MRAAAALILIAFFAAVACVSVMESAPQPDLPIVDASVPTQSAPLMLPPQLCPSPWPVCVQCKKPRSLA